MTDRRGRRVAAILVGASCVAAVAAVVAYMAWSDPFGKGGPRLAPEFQWNISDQRRIDPALIQYEQVQVIPVGLTEVRGLAVGGDNRIYVAGDQSVVVFDPRGVEASRFPLDGPPNCLAVPADGTIYAGLADHVEVFSPTGRRLAAWPSVAAEAVLTSIAVGEGDVFVADYASRTVVQYDATGRLRRRIDGKNSPQDAGFIVPSPTFDVALAPDGLLRVANPGQLRVEAYTRDGDRAFFWGKGGPGIAEFAGCCNPTHIAVLGDGRIVTSEKGLSRVKVYQADSGREPRGVLESVVAGSDVLGTADIALDVAADSSGRILVLDPAAKSVRVFVRKAAVPPGGEGEK